MNEQSEDKQAWAWYNRATMVLHHVGFNEHADHGPEMARISMEFDIALDIASGKSQLFEYDLTQESDQLVIHYKKKTSTQRHPKLHKAIEVAVDKKKFCFNKLF